MRRLVIAALALGLAACSKSGENLVQPTTSISGIYNLVTIDGQALPFTWPDGLVETSATATLNPDGTGISAPVYATGVISVDSGTYSVSNGTATFVNEAGTTQWHGSVDGHTLVVTAAGDTFVFVKQD
ncbi:MAG TPA: hypothetical protein VHV78_12000 [Gemmatimonadaceae bacterium]|jgi:hypothetical protein|nr:hypothetical protein [Gemmatimonadaceae bacterium]